jgi:hypothetical protein
MCSALTFLICHAALSAAWLQINSLVQRDLQSARANYHLMSSGVHPRVYTRAGQQGDLNAANLIFTGISRLDSYP